MVGFNKDVADPKGIVDKHKEGIKKRLANINNEVDQFVKHGKKLLEETNKPNVITLEQFLPFLPLFQMDKEKYDSDPQYEIEMNKLYNRYIRGLNINLYEPTLVVRSKEDSHVVAFLNRRFTRIKSDVVKEGMVAQRDSVPGAVSRAASMSRDDMLLGASLKDLVMANDSPEQKAYFRKIIAETQFINGQFIARNMTPEKRQELLGNKTEDKPSEEPSSGFVPTTILIDDDD